MQLTTRVGKTATASAKEAVGVSGSGTRQTGGKGPAPSAFS